MKKLIFCSLFVLTTTLFSQETDTTYWNNKLKAGLTYNQASFSDNWKGGGNNTVSIGGIFFGNSTYQRDIIEWVSQVDFQYGRTYSKEYDKPEFTNKFRKSVDKLSLDSKFGYRINKKWNAYSSLSLLSQFAKGYRFDSIDHIISNSFAPAYITSSWGLEYKPTEFFYARVAPFSPRLTIVKDTSIYVNVPENYGVKIGETTRYEWKAFKLNASFEKDLIENISLKANYEMFANLEGITTDNIDHRLDVIATAKIYRFLNLTLTSNFIKDIDQINIETKEAKWQISFQLGLSILFNYTNQTKEE